MPVPDQTPAEPVASVPDTDVYLDAARRSGESFAAYAAEVMGHPIPDTGVEARAESRWFRAAVDAARAPLLAELDKVRAGRFVAEAVARSNREHVEYLTAEHERVKAELVEARAAALPEGGEWRTVRGWMNGDRFQTYTSSAEGFTPAHGPTHRRRTWTGPVEPLTETETSAR